MISRSRSDFWCFHRDVLRFVLVFWLRSNGIFRSLPSGKLVSQTSRLGIRPALPTVEAQGAHPQRSRQTTPLHSTSNAGSVPKRWLARVLLVRPFAALVWPGSSLSFGSITLSLRHCCRWLQPDILPWLRLAGPITLPAAFSPWMPAAEPRLLTD